MAYFTWETYRHGDPIENLLLSVTLRRRQGVLEDGAAQSSFASPGSGRTQLSSPKTRAQRRKRSNRLEEGDEAAGSDEEAEDDELLATQPVGADDEDEEQPVLVAQRTFHWQEKVFGPLEVRAIRPRDEGSLRGRRRTLAFWRNAALDATPIALSNHHREVFERQEREAIEKDPDGPGFVGEKLFSRVHSEQYFDPSDAGLRFTDSPSEVVTPLARNVASGAFVQQHRDMLGEAASVHMYIFACLPVEDETEKAEARSFLRRSIIGSFVGGGGGAQGGPEQQEVLLCTLRLYPGGRLDVKPPFSVEPRAPGSADPNALRKGRWYHVPGYQGRYEFCLENLAEAPKGSGGGDRSAPAYESITERMAKVNLHAKSTVSRSLPEPSFAAPSHRAARVHYLVELESASGFGPRSLYVAYYALAAPGWKLLPHCVASAVTQTSEVRGDEQRAVLCFPIELTLESDGPPTEARPPLSLFFSIVSRDAHDRMTQLGYAHHAPPAVAGMETSQVGAWRIAEGRVDAMRRFFVGGAEELRDLRALSLPEGFDVMSPQCLNKHGLRTVSTGSLTLKTSTIVQQQQAPLATKPAAKGAAADKKAADALRRSAPEMGSLRGVLGVNTLARSETNQDKVKRRYEERLRAQQQ